VVPFNGSLKAFYEIMEKKSKTGNIEGWLRTIGVAIIIGLLVSGIFKPTIVKGYSMFPAIAPSDYLIINRIPYLVRGPQRGEIVVFHTELDIEDATGDISNDNFFIKRVIGVGGDKVEIRGGALLLNDSVFDEDYLDPNQVLNDMKPVTVSNGYLFVMGDNRGRSLDSRNEKLGEVAIADIKGRVDLRIYPFSRFGVMDYGQEKTDSQ
jgi:signal peptidase I